MQGECNCIKYVILRVCKCTVCTTAVNIWVYWVYNFSKCAGAMSVVLPLKAPFSTNPWEQTSCLLCERSVNSSLPFDLGHFEYYLAQLIVVVSQPPLALWFGLRLLLILVGWPWCFWQLIGLIPAANRLQRAWTFLLWQKD